MRVTEHQIKTLIHESNLIEGYDDEKFDKFGLIAWRQLLNTRFEGLTHDVIKEVQKIVTVAQTDLKLEWRGEYRKVDVYIAGRKGAAPGLVKGLMDNWLLDYQTMDPIDHHIAFEKIHPFVDGNGRTGRLLLWWTQKCRDEELSIITKARVADYYRWFK